MTLLELTEAGGPVDADLTGEQARALAATGFVEVTPSPSRPGRWRVRSDRSVGAARVAGIEVRIRPKVPVDRLLFLLGYARDPRGWRTEDVSFEQTPDLVPALGQALWRQVDRATRPGVLQGYVTVEPTLPVLRGRLREADQLRRHYGLPHPLEVRHDEYTVDIAENQILATAIARMLRVPGVDSESRRMLHHLAQRLGDVSLLRRGADVPRWHVTRLNAQYHQALRLAEIVLTNGSIEPLVGDVAGAGFIMDMWRVYEDFLSVALSQHIPAVHGGRVQLQRPDHLDVGRRLKFSPDIVWLHGDHVLAVIDAKYKTRTPEDDLYQMLAYCTVYGLRIGHLVYVGQRPPLRHTVRTAGIDIHCHSLDLDQAPSALLAAVAALGDLVVAHARDHVPA